VINIMPSLLYALLVLVPAQGMGVPFTSARFREHVAYLASDALGGRDVGTEGSAKSADYLIRHLKEYGAKGLAPNGDWFQSFPFQKRTGRNMLGIVEGKGELAKEAIVVSAHHDHLGTDPDLVKAGKDGIYNGADDNASGCAALLLVAEALHADRDRLPSSCRSVIFASFDAEERGLVGSRYYVSHPLWPLDRTAANLNFDMVGRLNGGKVMAADSESNLFLTSRLKALAAECGLRVETRLGGSRRADNASFLDREIPAVHFNSGLHADYHQVTDEVDKIDAEGGARISWMVYRLLREAMQEPGRLRYRRLSPEFDIQSILQLVFKMGIIPEQNAQGGKYPRINFVLRGSIAAKYGLEAKDEITSVNGTGFDRLEDAAIAFARLRLDKGMKLRVLRKGKEVEVVFPPEAFKDFTGPAIKPLANDRFEVTFRYKPTGKVGSVSLAGTFNNWHVTMQPMEGPDKEGFYSTRLILKQGTYEYKFVTDGKNRVTDPTNMRKAGPQGNSLLQLGQSS
jgi:hypothetical protein